MKNKIYPVPLMLLYINLKTWGHLPTTLDPLPLQISKPAQLGVQKSNHFRRHLSGLQTICNIEQGYPRARPTRN